MKIFEVPGQARESVGKKASKKLRVDDQIPCVLYGGAENIHFSVDVKVVDKMVYTPKVYSYNISVDGKSHSAIVQTMQFHPTSDKVTHIDFLQVFEDKPIAMDIPVKMIGVAKGVREGGKIQVIQRRLRIKGLLKDIPDALDVKVDNVGLGQSIKVGQLQYDNLEVLSPKNSVVVIVKLTRAAKGLLQQATTEKK